jgi:hypothetical protein
MGMFRCNDSGFGGKKGIQHFLDFSYFDIIWFQFYISRCILKYIS